MEQVNHFLPLSESGELTDCQSLTSTTSQTSAVTKFQNAVIRKFWRRMTEVYGNRWTSGYGDDPNESWSKALARLDPMDIKRGIDRMIEINLEWPPTLTEFLSHCRPLRSAPEHRISLPPPRNVNRELGLQGVEKLKSIMGVKS
jgi:hypothetical protein